MSIFPDYSKRTYGLDILRAIAIILVVHGHGKFMITDTWFDQLPFRKWVDGVNLFFVLSGFLIGTILLKIIHNQHYQLKFQDLFQFWKRRWFRTLPNYYLVLLLNILFVGMGWISGDLKYMGIHFFVFLQNFAWPFGGIFWESWSLTIEEWFYLILPVLFLFLLRYKKHQTTILWGIIALIVIPLGIRIIQSPMQVDTYLWDVHFRKVVIVRLDAIIYGVLASYIKFYHEKWWTRMRVPALIVGMLLILVIAHMPIDQNHFYMKTFYFSTTAFSIMLLLPFFDGIPQFRSGIGKFVTHISIISYAMYLINLALVAQVIERHFPVADTTDGTLKYGLYWLIVLVASTILYVVYEKPMTNLRDRKFQIGKFRF